MEQLDFYQLQNTFCSSKYTFYPYLEAILFANLKLK